MLEWLKDWNSGDICQVMAEHISAPLSSDSMLTLDGPSSFHPVSGKRQLICLVFDKPAVIMCVMLCNTIAFSLLSQNNKVCFSCRLVMFNAEVETQLRKKNIKQTDKGCGKRRRWKQQDRQERLGIDYWLLWSCQGAEESCSTAAWFAFVCLFFPLLLLHRLTGRLLEKKKKTPKIHVVSPSFTLSSSLVSLRSYLLLRLWTTGLKMKVRQKQPNTRQAEGQKCSEMALEKGIGCVYFLLNANQH